MHKSLILMPTLPLTLNIILTLTITLGDTVSC